MISRRRISISLISVVLLFFIIIFSHESGREKASGIIMQPFVAIGRGLSSKIKSITLRRDLGEENESLKATTLRLAIDQARLLASEKENEELKLLLGYKEKAGGRLVTARITVHLKDPFVNVIRLDRGQIDGLTAGDPVVADQGVFLGFLSEVYEHSADVLLALDPRSKLEARVLGRDGATGVLEGQGIVYRLGFIPREAGVNRDDLVITTVPTSENPLVIGLVRGIESDTETPFDRLVIEPLRDPYSLTFVGVLTR